MVLVVNEKNFSEEVLASPAPVIVNFWAPWCGLCSLINPLLSELQASCNEPLKLVNVNADENLKLANNYRLKTLPTVLLIHQGNILQRFENFHSYEDLRYASETFKSALALLQTNYSLTS